MVNKPRTDTLNEGLLGYWSFDGPDMAQGTNNTWALDRSGNGNKGVLRNMATSTARVKGKIGQALDFDGTNDDVKISGSSLNNLDPFTYTAWFKIPRNAQATNDTIIGKLPGGDGKYLRLGGGQPDQLQFHVDRPTDADALTNANAISRNKWTFVAATYNSTDGPRIYLGTSKNPVSEVSYLSRTAGSGSAPDDSGVSLFIGALGASTQNFKGPIDDVRIYNRVLSLDEIKRLYNMGR